jgi:hypothetical protein
VATGNVAPTRGEHSGRFARSCLAFLPRGGIAILKQALHTLANERGDRRLSFDGEIAQLRGLLWGELGLHPNHAIILAELMA